MPSDIDPASPASHGRAFVRELVADRSADPELRMVGYGLLAERRQLGRAAHYQAEIVAALEEQDRIARTAAKEHARLVKPSAASPAWDEGDGPRPRVFRHPDGRTWRIRLLDATTIQIGIVLEDGETIDRTRTCDGWASDIVPALVAEQIGEGFVEVEA